MELLVVAAAAVLGAVLGSFANVAIHRWPRGGTVLTPRGSQCPACEAPIRARDNIPVLSWLLLEGRCRDCGAAIAPRYPLVEASMAIIWGATTWIHGLDWVLPALLALGWVLVVAGAIDLEHRIIPNRLTYRAPVVLLALLLLATALDGAWVDLRRGLLAGVAIPAGMLALSETFRAVRGQAGMGMGDIKLALSIGLVVGYLGGWELVVFGYATVISAVVVAGGLLLTGRARLASRIPYGPYLALGALVAVLAGGALAGPLARFVGIA